MERAVRRRVGADLQEASNQAEPQPALDAGANHDANRIETDAEMTCAAVVRGNALQVRSEATITQASSSQPVQAGASGNRASNQAGQRNSERLTCQLRRLAEHLADDCKIESVRVLDDQDDAATREQHRRILEAFSQATVVDREDRPDPERSAAAQSSAPPRVRGGCFRCGEEGHFEAQCQHRRSCYAYNKPGHKAHECRDRAALKRRNEFFAAWERLFEAFPEFRPPASRNWIRRARPN